jgi:hypothetical protein
MVSLALQSRRRDIRSTGPSRWTISILFALMAGVAPGSGDRAQARPRPPADAPMPQPRPSELLPAPQPAPTASPAPTPPQPEVKADSAPVQPADDCIARLTAQGWEVEAAPQMQGQEACTIEKPVQVKRLRLSGAPGRSIDFPARPLIACAFAERLGQFVSEAAVPMIAGRLGTELKAIDTGPGFSCRTRNHAPNGKMSAHGLGIALDIAGFELANGERLPVTETSGEAKLHLLAGLRSAACGWFTTILGPGTDPSHATHWHFDILKHGTSDYYRICQ